MKYLIIGIIVIIVGISLLVVYRTNNSTEGGYSCYENIYNCSDFLSQREAQDVFNACGSGDIHNLDGDNDGIVCEEL